MAPVDTGNQLQLGQLLGSGGQGRVYRIANRDDQVVKVYHEEQQPSAAELQRIDRLIATSNPLLLDCCAWPLSRQSVEGRVAVIMRRIVESQELHMLIDRSSRISHFRHADWQFMVQTAQHLAQACSQVHAAGLLLVDISEKNVLVNRSAEVYLIDCDGFVFQGGGDSGCSTTFTLQWTAPELRGQPLASTERTINHDNYALARALFKLLFQGSEPMQSLDGDSDTPSERVFVFSRRHPVRTQAPFALTLDDVPPEIADLFEQAFDPASASPGGRPTAAQWARALTEMLGVMHRCPRSASHSHVRGLPGGCPWCARAAIRPDYDDFRDEAIHLLDPTPLHAPTQKRLAGIAVGIAVGIGTFTIAAPIFMNLIRAHQEEAMRSRSAAFVAEQFAIINNPQAIGNELLPRYAPDADVYDRKKVSHPGHWFEKRVRAWSSRFYEIIPSSLIINCSTTNQTCDADLIVQYQFQLHTNPTDPPKVQCWNYIYKLNMSASDPIIFSEKKGTRRAPNCPDENPQKK